MGHCKGFCASPPLCTLGFLGSRRYITNVVAITLVSVISVISVISVVFVILFVKRHC